MNTQEQSLYPLQSKDIESIAKGRVSRRESKKTNGYLTFLVCMLVVGIGLAYWVSYIGGLGAIVVGVIVYLVLMSSINKKQRDEIIMLKREWKSQKDSNVVSQ